MRAYLVAVPMWLMSVFMGVFFGAAMTVYSVLREDSLPLVFLVVMGALVGAAFGITMHLLLARDIGPGRDELAALPVEQRRAVLRAVSGRNPVPADPLVRQVALNQVLRARNLYRRRNRFNLTVFGVALVLYAVLAIGRNPLWWLAFAVFAAFFVGQFVLPRRLDRRAAELSSPAQAPR